MIGVILFIRQRILNRSSNEDHSIRSKGMLSQSNAKFKEFDKCDPIFPIKLDGDGDEDDDDDGDNVNEISDDVETVDITITTKPKHRNISLKLLLFIFVEFNALIPVIQSEVIRSFAHSLMMSSVAHEMIFDFMLIDHISC